MPKDEYRQPVALQACERCSKRKKRCDRLIPQCSGCVLADKPCHYVDKSRGFYSVQYVKSLEQQVIALKMELARNNRSDISGNDNFDELEQTAGNSRSGTVDSGLAEDLGRLSLSASGDGQYLGPGSGISFAKFTQSFIYQMDSRTLSMMNDGIVFPEKSKTGNSLNHSLPDMKAVASGLEKSDTFTEIPLPNADRTNELAAFYFKHSHTLYPFVKKSLFMKRLDYMLQPSDDHQLSGLEKNPIWLFEMFMVLAIGSTSMATISVSNEDEAIICCQKAMSYLPDILAQKSSVALEGILLLVSYSFFNRMGPDTWYLVGIASRLALGMGLHTEKSLEKLPEAEKEHSRRVFWSVYMMDRVVSTTLGRPLAIRDMDIDISEFSALEETGESSADLEVTLKIIALRRIAGEILEQVYSVKNTSNKTKEERLKVLADLHKKLILWRLSMPVLDEEKSRNIPHLSVAWSDLNYSNMLLMLFRPSPLWPQPPAQHFHLLAEASVNALKQFDTMYSDRKLSFNWLNLFSVFGACLSLIFITNSQSDWNTYVSPSVAINALSRAEKLFKRFSMKFSPAKEFLRVVHNGIEEIIEFSESPLEMPCNDHDQFENQEPDRMLLLFYMSNNAFYTDMSQIDDEVLNSTTMNMDDNLNYSNDFLDMNSFERPGIS